MIQKWDSKKYSESASFVSTLGLPVLDLLAPKPNEKILDLGCGDGTLANEILSFGCEVIGVDASDSMVAATKEKGIPAFHQSGEALEFDNQFDAVFSNAALHWMTDYRVPLLTVHFPTVQLLALNFSAIHRSQVSYIT